MSTDRCKRCNGEKLVRPDVAPGLPVPDMLIHCQACGATGSEAVRLERIEVGHCPDCGAHPRLERGHFPGCSLSTEDSTAYGTISVGDDYDAGPGRCGSHAPLTFDPEEDQ
jgi:hypothetical protein